MGPMAGTWICRRCGGPSDVGVAPDASGHCERCVESSEFGAARAAAGLPPPGASGEEFRRGVVARLRAYYAVARELVDAKASSDPHHEHLEWILGTRSNPAQDDAGLEAGVSELVVLWLEDLASDLDGSIGLTRTPNRVGGRHPAAGRRESAARGLRVATRDFADAFLTDRLQAVGCP
jgi:hypothetical protein